MSQLTISTQPGFFDLADSTIAGGQPLTDDSLQKISHNAKFGAVRHERIFMGFYANGNVVPAPISPVDSYQYSYSEISFQFSVACTRAPAPGFVPGQATFPAIANTNAGPGSLYRLTYDVNDANGAVLCLASYWTGSTETPTTDGIVKVYAHCQRLSQTLPTGAGGN